MRGPHPQSHVTLRYCGHVTNKNVISPLSQVQWTPKLTGWWLRMGGPLLQSHVINKKRYIPTFTRPIDPKLTPKLGRVLNQDEGAPPKNSRDTSIVWSPEKPKMSYVLNHKAVEMQKKSLCLPRINTKMPTRTKNVEMK